MSSQSTAAHAAQRAGSGIARLGRAGRALPPDRRLAAAAALGLCLTLFLPWYQETGFASGKSLQTKSASLTGWHAFSWVEAAVLLVSASVLTLLFLRAEGRAFHLPGGDGSIVMLGGAWTCLLVIWRIFDKQSTTSNGQFGTTFGIKWGIFTAMALAGLLAYAGTRIRAAHQPEPPLPGEEPAGAGVSGSAPSPTAVGSRPRRSPSAGPARAGAPSAVPVAGASEREARGTRRPRRAHWAEPVTWEEPATLAGPSVETPGSEDPTRVLDASSAEDPA
jgi:hypothetical protein